MLAIILNIRFYLNGSSVLSMKTGPIVKNIHQILIKSLEFQLLYLLLALNSIYPLVHPFKINKIMRIQMKSFLLTTLSVFALTSAVFLSSCKEDKCKAVVCAYDGTCNEDGSCSCVVGYEGERCETVTRDKFKGVWNVTEDGTNSNPQVYAVSVENGNKIDEVLVRNFNNKFNAEVTAQVKGDTIYVAQQQMTSGGDIYTVEGKGYAVPETFYGLHGKLVLSYKVTSPDGSINDFGTGGGQNPAIWTK